MFGEEWRPIDECQGRYEVSSMGRVRSLGSGGRRSRILSASSDRYGYLRVSLCLGSEGQLTRFVHRLVATAFIGGDGETVNHKDGNKRNNLPENLEWATRAENVRHAVNIGLSPHAWKRRPVVGVGPDGRGLYVAAVIFARRFGFCPSAISKAARGRKLDHKGWTWSYA